MNNTDYCGKTLRLTEKELEQNKRNMRNAKKEYQGVVRFVRIKFLEVPCVNNERKKHNSYRNNFIGLQVEDKVYLNRKKFKKIGSSSLVKIKELKEIPNNVKECPRLTRWELYDMRDEFLQKFERSLDE